MTLSQYEVLKVHKQRVSLHLFRSSLMSLSKVDVSYKSPVNFINFMILNIFNALVNDIL